MTPRIPTSTYRLQLSARFGFDRVRRILPYLDRLGVDTVYLSPILASQPGSEHGYDGIDPGRIDPARGGAAGFARLRRDLERRGFGLLVDFVPNHLAASLQNPAWRDVLARGPSSPYARIFDIDWSRGPEGRPAVVLPWLGRSRADAFRRGELAFDLDRGSLSLRFGVRKLPGSPAALRRLMEWDTGAEALPGRRRPDRRRELRERLERLNRGVTGRDRSRREQLLTEFSYRLVPWWEVGSVNYRRFFDISGLVGVRPEDPEGFRYLHRWLLPAARSGAISGIRLDHIDGLADPLGYLRRLRAALAGASSSGRRAAPYLIVEKILARDETLPASWPVDGTTGYEALVRITGVLVDEASAPRLSAMYARICPERPGSFADESYRAKREVAEELFPGERAELVRRIRGGRGATVPYGSRNGIDRALVAVTAALPVYRTYYHLGPGGGRGRPEDARRLRAAISEARRRDPGALQGDGLRAFLRLASGSGAIPPGSPPARFLTRWQQWTGAVAAKGGEDTAFYRHGRFLGANEVGGDPDRIATTLGDFHAFMRERARRFPHALTPTSTHDTKWGEDARARLVALTEWVEPWSVSVRRWRRDNRAFTSGPARRRVPSPAEEYRLYQTLVASAPSPRSFSGTYPRRLEGHLVKAAREAKLGTSWMRPVPAHEEALTDFVRAIVTDPRGAGFRADLSGWVDRLAFFGGFYSFAQTVLRATLPGVPDLYQGSEGWNLTLADPDNRRPVPFGRLARGLAR
ncbi:MAG: malto-oligosyltrehalose synthase, partial [Thermoplasmata archaeon]